MNEGLVQCPRSFINVYPGQTRWLTPKINVDPSGRHYMSRPNGVSVKFVFDGYLKFSFRGELNQCPLRVFTSTPVLSFFSFGRLTVPNLNLQECKRQKYMWVY